MDQEQRQDNRAAQTQQYVGFYYKNMVTGRTMSYKGDEQFLAPALSSCRYLCASANWAYEGRFL